MTTTIKLSDTQQHILQHAIDHDGGQIVWFPDNVKGGARQKVIQGLFDRALITRDGKDNWFVAAEGYDALGRERPAFAPLSPDPEIEAAVAAAEIHWTQKNVRTRAAHRNSKQADVIRMLQRPEGATIRQICEATGWQAHTVRGTFAGAFKKRLGLNLVSEKDTQGERVYRVS